MLACLLGVHPTVSHHHHGGAQRRAEVRRLVDILSALCSHRVDVDATMSEVVDAGGLTPDFLQPRVSSSARHVLALLEHALGDVTLSNLLDGRWMASSSPAICTLAIYAALQGRVSGPPMSELNWEGFAPKKVKVFLWILRH